MSAKKLVAIGIVVAAVGASAWVARSQTRPSGERAAAGARLTQGEPLYVLDNAYLRRWLLPADQPYASIDGYALKQLVREITAISRWDRDEGHQHWGRIIGTGADWEMAAWVETQLKAINGVEVRVQKFDLPPQTYPHAWDVSISFDGTSQPLATAEPVGLRATPPGGLDLEAVFVGLGSEAEFSGRDVKGKAVFIYSVPSSGVWQHSAMFNGAPARAEKLGAAAVFVVIGIPGNVRSRAPIGGAVQVPAFSMGQGDGETVRTLIERGLAGGRAPRVKIRYETKTQSGLSTASIWGVIPGNSDENVMIVAHRDGYFEGANDNATGVATAIGLAKDFASIPREKRRRTVQIVATPGHHNAGAPGATWLAENQATVFAKTAFLINAEHTAQTQMYAFGSDVRRANQAAPFLWYVGGSKRLQAIVVDAYDRFGVSTYSRPDTTPPGEIGRLAAFVPSIQLIDAGIYYHTDAETDDTVPPTGLEAVTRAYAKIIDMANAVDLAALR